MLSRKKSLIKKFKELPTLTKFVLYCFTMILIFTTVILILAANMVTVPDVLITCFYSVHGGEVLFCCLIKIFKLRTEGNEFDAIQRLEKQIDEGGEVG